MLRLSQWIWQRTSSSSRWPTASGAIVERHRLNRARFARFFVHRPPCQVVMEACGSAHHWARRILAQGGHTVRLLPAHYVKPYVGRSKTDRADAAALIEAARSPRIREVPIKTLEQQRPGSAT